MDFSIIIIRKSSFLVLGNSVECFTFIAFLHKIPASIQCFVASELALHYLTLKAPSTTAADDIYRYFFHCFSEKKGLIFYMNPLPVNPLPGGDSHETSSRIFFEK